MQYTITQVKQNLYQKIYEVYEVFKSFFGEEFTDLQGIPSDEDVELLIGSFVGKGCYKTSENTWEIPDTILKGITLSKKDIIVWWPSVTVTNEYNNSITVKDLYAKIEVTPEGSIPYENTGFQLTRATFSHSQFDVGYIHSHISKWYGEDLKFRNPCLGTGPIRQTILDLKNESDEIKWMLFCQELSVYVTVESLKGGPYIRMESVGAGLEHSKYRGYKEVESRLFMELHYTSTQTEEEFKLFLRKFTFYYLQYGNLRINYNGGEFKVGMPYYDFMIDISNAFINWYNEGGGAGLPIDKPLLIENVQVSQGKFYRVDSISHKDPALFEGNHLLYFKGRDITIHIETPTEEEEGKFACTLLKQEIAMYILYKIFLVINYRYSNGNTGLSESERTGEGNSSSHKAVSYL